MIAFLGVVFAMDVDGKATFAFEARNLGHGLTSAST
jgi:hypothetical protein